MAMSPILKWQRSIECSKKAREKQKQRRKDIQDLKNAGAWQDPRTRYLDEDGYPLPDAPQWWLNLRKAWNVNDQSNTARMPAAHLDRDEPSKTPQRKKRYKKVDRKPKVSTPKRCDFFWKTMEFTSMATTTSVIIFQIGGSVQMVNYKKEMNLQFLFSIFCSTTLIPNLY